MTRAIAMTASSMLLKMERPVGGGRLFCSPAMVYLDLQSNSVAGFVFGIDRV